MATFNFVKPSSSPFETQSLFGQNNIGSNSNNSSFIGQNNSNNTFGTKSLFGQTNNGSSNPFGMPLGRFGPTQSPSNTASTPAFGVPSMPDFASSTPPFRATATVGFGSFGASSQAAGSTNTLAVGSENNSAFRSTATPTFSSTAMTFGVSNAPTFGSSTTSTFSFPRTPVMSYSSTPSFGASNPTTCGVSTAFGASTASISSESTSPIRIAPFGTTAPPSRNQSTPFATQHTTSILGNPSLVGSPFGGHDGARRILAYSPTPEIDVSNGTKSTVLLKSMSAMPMYTSKSHEELRWEDYQCGDKGSFGASSQAAGSTNTLAVGSENNSAFRSTATPTFSSTAMTFGVSNAPTFGSSTTSTFSFRRTPVMSYSSTPSFGASNTATCGVSTAFGASTASISSESTSPIRITPFGTTAPPSRNQNTPFATQHTKSILGNPSLVGSPFWSHDGARRILTYSPTPEIDVSNGTKPTVLLKSMSAMPMYTFKSHEELRWEDYPCGDRGGTKPASQPAHGISSSPTQMNLFGVTGTIGQTAVNPFSTCATSSPFDQKTPTFRPSSVPAFGPCSKSPSIASNLLPFVKITASDPPTFGPSSNSSSSGMSCMAPFGEAFVTPFNFRTSATPVLGPISTTSASSIFNSSFASLSLLGTSPAVGPSLNSSNPQSFEQPRFSTPLVRQKTPAFEQTTTMGQATLLSTPSIGSSWSFPTANSGSSTLTTSNPVGSSQTILPLVTTQLTAPLQTSGASNIFNFNQTQPVSSSSGSVSNVSGQSSFEQLSAANQNNMIVQPVPITNPFGTLPAIPQMSIGHAGSAPSVQYGISSMPVADKPTPIRISFVLTSRHLSQRRITAPLRKYHPKKSGPLVPFFEDEDKVPSMPKACPFVPRENIRSFICPAKYMPSRASTERQSQLDGIANPVHENENEAKNNFEKQHNASSSPSKSTQEPNGVHNDHAHEERIHHRSSSPNMDLERLHKKVTEIEGLVSKLRSLEEYYTEPQFEELVTKEKAEAGFCSRVKDFMIGRHGYGSIRFIGETDVRGIDFESVVHFKNREVIVYMDESKKPPIGQGLNKPAEVTLLNIKFFNKKTGKQYMEGPIVEKYKEMLMKKAKEQGAEFLSYDPVKGEWKFKVDHFSRYGLCDGDDLWG